MIKQGEYINNDSRIRLAAGVYFTKLGDQVFARNVVTHFEYLYNETAWEILIGAKENLTFSRLIDVMADKYAVASRKEAEDMIRPFLMRLLATGIIVILNGKKVESVNKSIGMVSNQVDAYCFKNQRLWSATLEITYRCNERCRHCYLDVPNEVCSADELSLEEYERIIDELYNLGCMKVLVTGGEPTLRHDFLQICRYITTKGMLLDVFTNALEISNACFDSLIQLNPNSISFSLYSGTAEFHDYITQRAGSFNATIKNLLALKCAGVDVYVKTVLFSGRFDEFMSLRDLCKRYRIHLTVSHFVIPGHSGKDKSQMAFSADDYKRFVETEYKDGSLEEDGNVPLLRDMNSPICQAGHTMLSIGPQGNVYPCNSVPIVIGNVRKCTLSEIWNKSKELDRIRSWKFGDISDKCRACQFSGMCVFCLGAALREGCGELKPCSTTCRNSEIRYDYITKCQMSN